MPGRTFDAPGEIAVQIGAMFELLHTGEVLQFFAEHVACTTCVAATL
jgi:hypothetical protein